MLFFELEVNDLFGLSPNDLEELVLRLCEAELANCGHSRCHVYRPSAKDVPDGGIDVLVDIPDKKFKSDYVPRAYTVIQVKTSKMLPHNIKNEMEGKGELFKAIKAKKGAYVLVSLKDTTPPPKREEIMKEVVKKLIPSHHIHLRYYNGSRLNQWLRQHDSVQLWAREKLGKRRIGWRPHESWTSTQNSNNDSFILSKGLSIRIPGVDHVISSNKEAIGETRKLIRSTSKAIRIVGLSGVGKTRFVQALFENDMGEEPLERSKVIYGVAGEDLIPTAKTVLGLLIKDKKEAIVVIDNCRSELHGILAKLIPGEESSIKLITIEYDIREDKPQTTEVVEFKAEGPEIAQELIRRHYPTIAATSALRIANLCLGNCLMALVIAEPNQNVENLAIFSDVQLFERLFCQRHVVDNVFKRQAEVLSLVYSFSVETEEEVATRNNELTVLGELCNGDQLDMHRTAKELKKRQIAQQRGLWFAVLPQPIANYLARDALGSIRKVKLCGIFEDKANTRLLKSFARRLGYLHDDENAKNIVSRWLRVGGLLHEIAKLDPGQLEILRHIAPVDPSEVLGMLEDQSTSITKALVNKDQQYKSILSDLLVRIAYKQEFFDQAIALLIKMALVGDPEVKNDSIRERIGNLFQGYWSGTHATLEQRLSVVRNCLSSSQKTEVSLGFNFLGSALRSNRFFSVNNSDFGAHHRDYGAEPNRSEFIKWLRSFLRLARKLALDDDKEKKQKARKIIAERFQEFWQRPELYDELADLCRVLNADMRWLKGWQAISSVLDLARSCDKQQMDDKKCGILESLCSELKPANVEEKMRSLGIIPGLERLHPTGNIDSDWHEKHAAAAFELGKKCQQEEGLLDRISPELFLYFPSYATFRYAFGRGLVISSNMPEEICNRLVWHLRKQKSKQYNLSVLRGAMHEISLANKELASKLLDNFALDDILERDLFSLHCSKNFNEEDFERCLRTFDRIGLNLAEIGVLLWHSEYDGISNEKKVRLAEKIITRDGGAGSLVEALGMKAHRNAEEQDPLGPDLRRLGLIAAGIVISSYQHEFLGLKSHCLQELLRICLHFKVSETQKSELLNALFTRIEGIDWSYDCKKVCEMIAAKFPHEFLTELFWGNKLKKESRKIFIANNFDWSPLINISPKIIVEWCQAGDDASRWPLVAQVVAPFCKCNNEEYKLSEQVMTLIEDSPEPDKIIYEFYNKLLPGSYMGMFSDEIAARAKAMEMLLEHSDQSIRTAANIFMSKAKKWEEDERAKEKQEAIGAQGFE